MFPVITKLRSIYKFAGRDRTLCSALMEQRKEKAMAGYVQNRLAMVALGLFVVVKLLSLEPSMGTEYQVGDQFAWGYDVDYDTWVSGKTFQAGDVLAFKYDPSSHNVVEVNKAGYDRCKSSPNQKTYNSGNDRITLTSGTKYYICQYHCDYANQKLMINVN